VEIYPYSARLSKVCDHYGEGWPCACLTPSPCGRTFTILPDQRALGAGVPCVRWGHRTVPRASIIPETRPFRAEYQVRQEGSSEVACRCRPQPRPALGASHRAQEGQARCRLPGRAPEGGLAARSCGEKGAGTRQCGGSTEERDCAHRRRIDGLSCGCHVMQGPASTRTPALRVDRGPVETSERREFPAAPLAVPLGRPVHGAALGAAQRLLRRVRVCPLGACVSR
jgi:hypothetical protein